MDYDIIFIKKAKVVYCKTCKQDPETKQKDVCNFCILAEIHKSALEPDKIHYEN